jgi:DNA-binding response OmpR family regulator
VPEILIATDADSVYDEIDSVVASQGTIVRRVRTGADVRESINAKPVDLAVVDLQIGSMGGVAVALDIRLEVDAGRLIPAPVLLLLDRRADVFLARRSGVEGWLLKPLDPLRIRRAVRALLGGGTFHDTSYLPQPVAVPLTSDSLGRTGK